jgi:hypothetical protein
MHDRSANTTGTLTPQHPPTFPACWSAWRYCCRLAAAIAACAASATPLNAADIKDGSRLGEVVLEGPIAFGDYDKLLSYVDAHEARSIYLASPGGSVIEAIKIGRLVRALKLETIAPVQTSRNLREKMVELHKLVDPNANYVCASACFFVYVAGVERSTDIFNLDGPILGIHRPYMTDGDLRNLSGDQAIASASQLRATVENYLREMSVPAKYTDLMFSVPKDEVRWIDRADYEADLEGIIPELKDWVDARCDTRTDVEKAAWAALKNKSSAQMTTAENAISEKLTKKMSDLDKCASRELSNLSHQAHLKMFWEPRKAALCADYQEYHSDRDLDARLAAAVPNKPSATALRDHATTAAICGDTATTTQIIRALADRGDAGAQHSLGWKYNHAGDKAEAVKWFRRAAEQGDDEAQQSLSMVYLLGDGVAQDYVEGLKWLTLAISRSKDNDARLALEENRRDWFISKMNPAQIADAERQASQWRPTPESDNRVHPSVPKARWWQFWK